MTSARTLAAKRLFDVGAAFFGLLLVLPLFPLIALLIKIESAGPVFFKQERVGLGFRRFLIYKFRTMRAVPTLPDGKITAGRDPRSTRIGTLLRRLKIDELPQLWNVLIGDMSLVGPRPELPYFVDLFRTEYAEVLRVRPGMTDLASLKYRDEATLLGQAADPRDEYVRRILPDKLRLAREYVERSSLMFDLALITRTVAALLMPAGAPPFIASAAPVNRPSDAARVSQE